MAIECRVAAVANRAGQVVAECQATRHLLRADEAAGLEMITRTQARFGKHPLQTNLELAPRVQMSVYSNGLRTGS